MDRDVLFLIFLFVCLADYCELLQEAKTCHYSLLSVSNPTACNDDLVRAKCSEGLIFITSVSHEDDNSNIPLPGTCCTKIDGQTSEEVINKLKKECNNKTSCDLSSVSSGTAIVEYECIGYETTSTPTTESPTNTTTDIDYTLSTTEVETLLTETDATDRTRSTPPQPGKLNSTKLKENKEFPAEVVIAGAVGVLVCLALVVITVFFCRRNKGRKRIVQAHAYIPTISIQPVDVEEAMPADDVPTVYQDVEVEEMTDEYNTTAELLGASNATANNDYDHVVHHQVKHTASVSLSGGAETEESVYDTTQESPHVPNLDNTYDHVGDTGVKASDHILASVGRTGTTVVVDDNYDVCNASSKDVFDDNTYDTMAMSPER